uniref:Formin like protein n=1 Tax=Tetrahymena thermophila TaxID=5911 RepID=Q4JF57_TETTH|nr:formin like protein [Tetrahymena thermophila]
MAQLNQETQNQLQEFNSIIKLLELKDKDKLGIQSLPKEKKLAILQLREKIQVKNDFNNYGKNSEEITEYFIQKMELNAQFEDIIAFYEWISYQIKYNQKLDHLEQSGGVDAIIFALTQYGSLKHDSAKKLFLLHILKILTVDYKDVFEDSTIFLDKLIQSDLVHSFPEMLTPGQNEINSLLLILMDQISWYSEEALKFILEGFEALQQKNNYPNKFTPLTIVLSKSKSSIFTQNMCSFLNSMCQAFQNHFKNIQIIDDFQNSGLLDLLTVQAVNNIQQGQFIIDDCYFIREDYYGVSGEEIFFVADFERREFNCNKFFYKKDQNEGDFQSQIITLFIQIHQLQDKSVSLTFQLVVQKVNRMREREAQYQKELQAIQQKKVQYNSVIKEEQEEEYVEKVKGSQKQAQLEERFKSEIQMREKEKMEQNHSQDNDMKKGFGRQNGIGKEKSEEKNQLWQTQQKIQALEKEIERLNQKLKQQDSQEQVSQNILKQQFLQGQLLENQKLEEKEKIISKYKQENIQLLTKVSELEQSKQQALEQLSLSKQQSQLQNQINQQMQKNEELSEKIKQLNENLSSVTFKYEEYKSSKEKEISQLNLTLSAIKAKQSVSEENKNNILEQNQIMNLRLSKLDSASKQLDSIANNHSKESVIKLVESQFLQEISDLKEQNQLLQSQINKLKSNQNQQNIDKLSIPENPQIPVAPLLGSQYPSQLAVPQAPNLGIPQAPQIPGIPQAPQIPGIPQVSQIPGIPQAPQIAGIPQAPQLFGIPQAPQIPGIPQAPQIPGIPQAPQIPGIPQAPQIPGIPLAPQIPGIPQAPQIPGVPQAPLIPGIPQAPNFSAPPAPQINGIGIPPVPQLGIPSVPSLPGFGAPAAPSLNIPGAPIAMAPILPGLMAPQVQQGIKPKKNPGIPMKGVNWQTLKFQDIQGTIWEKVKEENIALEEEYLKQTFSQKATLQKAQNTTQQNPEQQASKKITFLTLERQQSVLLILGKIKLKGEQIAEMLISCDPTRLTQNLITSLLASLPNEQEMIMVQSYDGKIENLGDAEKYFKALEKVNGYEERLQALKFKNLYPETKEFLTSKTTLIAQFLDSLLNDQRITIILENALALGNYMNGTGFKGGAWGFKFSNIDKMVEVKSMDGKVNLLMYMISNIEKKEGKEIVKVDEDLKILDECTKTPINQLISEIADLKRGVKTLEKSIKVQTSNEQDKIKEQIEPFYLQVQPEITELEKQVKDLEAKYKTVAEFFCEDPRKLPSDEFAKQVLIFKKSCITAKIQNKNLKR